MWYASLKYNPHSEQQKAHLKSVPKACNLGIGIGFGIGFLAKKKNQGFSRLNQILLLGGTGTGAEAL